MRAFDADFERRQIGQSITFRIVKRDFRGTDAYALEPDPSGWQGNVVKIYDTVVDPAKGSRAIAVYEVTIDPNCYVIGNVRRDF